MTAFNAVRFRVKPGREEDFLNAHSKVERNWPGMQHANIIKTGERTYCIIVEWTDMAALAAARPQMITQELLGKVKALFASTPTSTAARIVLPDSNPRRVFPCAAQSRRPSTRLVECRCPKHVPLRASDDRSPQISGPVRSTNTGELRLRGLEDHRSQRKSFSSHRLHTYREAILRSV